jgi:uncharacterized protein (TIGR02757 family)
MPERAEAPPILRARRLKPLLERLYGSYDFSCIHTDPIEFVHMFKDDRDREVVALIASSLAYGRVGQIKKSIAGVIDIMGREPHRFTLSFSPEKHRKAFASFAHRFSGADDIRCLIYFARQMIEEGGSIESFFLKGYEDDIKTSLISFSQRALSLRSDSIYGAKSLPRGAGVRFFFPSPRNGSACKRLNLFMRWMVRKDTVDFGIWKKIPPSKLVIPLDTHIARISVRLGLTKRRSPDWKMAEEVTENLKKFDPEDPVKYDFALTRLGILKKGNILIQTP